MTTTTFEYQATTNCPKCGEAVVLPESANDDDPVKCKSCGADLGTYQDIVDAVREAAKEQFRADIQGTLERLFGRDRSVKLTLKI